MNTLYKVVKIEGKDLGTFHIHLFEFPFIIQGKFSSVYLEVQARLMIFLKKFKISQLHNLYFTLFY